MEAKPKLTYSQTIDMMRIISILAVILIHCSTRIIETTHNDLKSIPLTLFLNQSARFAVPLFFMLSGFVAEINYPYQKNYQAYLKKRVKRILVPYVFWSLIYYYLIYTNHHGAGFLTALTDGSASYQLYFIPVLLIFYVIFPVIHKLLTRWGNKWVLILAGLIELGLLSENYYNKPLPLFYPISVALFNFFVFVLGAYISHHKDRVSVIVNRWKYGVFAGVVLGAVYIFWEGGSRFYQSHNYLAFYSQWRPSILLYTLLISGLLFYCFHQLKGPVNYIKRMAGLSFSVFFVHVIVLEYLWRLVFKDFFQPNQIWYNPLFFGATTTASFVIAYLIHKIPLLSEISG